MRDVQAMIKHRADIEAAIIIMDRAGFEVIWTPPIHPGEKHFFVCRQRDSGEQWMITSSDGLAGITALMEQCGFEDLD